MNWASFTRCLMRIWKVKVLLSDVQNAKSGLAAFKLLDAAFERYFEPDKNKDTERLAQNGKPSNLNAMQYKQVRTAEFKAWFGDWENDSANASKVVDENGEPLLVYHGTENDFNEFNKGSDIFFADQYSTAEYYADGGNIYSVFLSAKKIFDIDSKKHISLLKSSKWYKKNKTTLDDYAFPFFDNLIDAIEAGNYEAIEESGFVDFIKAEGFDGYTTYEQDGKNYAVFNPNQIKSAIGNKGSFSTKSNNILDDTTQSQSELLTKIIQSPSGLSAFKLLKTLFNQLEYKDKPIADLIDSGDFEATFRAVLARYETEDDYVKQVGLKNILDLLAKKDLSPELMDDYHNIAPPPWYGSTAYREKMAIDAIDKGKGFISSFISDVELSQISSIANSIKNQPDFSGFITDEIKRLNIKQNELFEKSMSYKRGDPEGNQIFADSQRVLREIIYLSSQRESNKKDPFKIATTISRLRIITTEKGKKAIDAILERSPVSHEKATAWAAKQNISKETFASIAKKGYPKEKLLADMAEFYRLTHGKLKDVSIGHSRRDRAHSAESADLMTGYIELGGRPDKRVLFHELAHNLESDVLAKELANGFLIKRRESPETYSLNRLVKGSGFNSHEKAYKDDFVNPYIGKVYRTENTEVFSMGVETLADPAKFAELIALDEEHAALILQYLTHDSEILNATRKLAGDVIEGKKQAQLSAEQELKAIINQLAPKAKLTINEVDFSPYYTYLAMYAGKDYKYIGSLSDDLHIIEGKIKENYRGRARKGFAILKMFHVSTIRLNIDAYIFRPRKELDAVIALSQLIGDSMDVANKLLSVESIKQLKKELQDVN